jgi:hypothetical protein
MNPIRVGSYVTHSMRPNWGIGKVFGQSAQHVLVGFAGLPEAERFKRLEWRVGLLEKAEVKSDPELDSWKVECDSTCHYISAAPKARRAAKPKEPKVAAAEATPAPAAEPVVAKAAKATVKETRPAVKPQKVTAKPAKAVAKVAAKPAKAAKPAAKKPSKPAKASKTAKAKKKR